MKFKIWVAQFLDRRDRRCELGMPVDNVGVFDRFNYKNDFTIVYLFSLWM